MQGHREGQELTRELAASGTDTVLGLWALSTQERRTGDNESWAYRGPVVASWDTAAAGGDGEPSLDSPLPHLVLSLLTQR